MVEGKLRLASQIKRGVFTGTLNTSLQVAPGVSDVYGAPADLNPDSGYGFLQPMKLGLQLTGSIAMGETLTLKITVTYGLANQTFDTTLTFDNTAADGDEFTILQLANILADKMSKITIAAKSDQPATLVTATGLYYLGYETP